MKPTPREDTMGAKGEALARQFEAKAQEAARILESLSDANWNKITEAERWSVGVTAHHLATSYERVPDIATGLAAGQSFGNFTRKMLDERNAQMPHFRQTLIESFEVLDSDQRSREH